MPAALLEIDISKPEGLRDVRHRLHDLDAAEALRVVDRNHRDAGLNGFRRAMAGVRILDAEKRTVELSFSSEQPVQRWFGTEILSHAEGAVDMDWINSGNAPLLWMHDGRTQIGVVESAAHDVKGKRTTAVVRLANDDEGTKFLNRVKDGIIKNVSVGYSISAWSRTTTETDDPDEDSNDIYTATRWRPHEISLVSTPADETVGVGRSGNTLVRCPDTKTLPTNLSPASSPTMSTAPATTEADAARAANEALQAAIANERARTSALHDLRRRYDPDGTLVKDDEFRAFIDNKDGKQDELAFRRYLEGKNATPTRMAPSGVVVTRNEGDNDPTPLLHALRGLVFGNMPKRFTEQSNALISASPKAFQPAAENERRLVIDSASVRANGHRFPGLDSGVRAQNAQQLAAGGALIGVTFAPEIIPYLRPQPVLEQAGARIMSGISGGPGNIRFPKQAGDIYASWAAAGVASVANQLPLGVLDLTPKRLVAQVQIDRQLLLQESFDIEAYVRNSINLQFALAYDLAGLIGNGNGMPLGILNTPNIQKGAVTFHGTNGSPRYSDFVSFRTKVLKANAGGLGKRAFISSPDSVQNWATVPLAPDGATTITNGLFVLDQDNRVRREDCHETTYLNTLPTAYQNAGYTLPVPDVVLYGPFGQYIFIEWAGVEWIYDPYTQASADLIVLTARLYVDGGCLQPTAFVTSSNAGSVTYAP
jgi:HK97 family phage prohead protease